DAHSAVFFRINRHPAGHAAQGFREDTRCSAVKNAERLGGFFVHRHTCLEIIRTNFCKLNPDMLGHMTVTHALHKIQHIVLEPDHFLNTFSKVGPIRAGKISMSFQTPPVTYGSCANHASSSLREGKST